MPPDLIVPPEIEAVIKEFDLKKSPFTEHHVFDALKKARGSLQNPGELENLGAWAEVLAFGLVETRRQGSPWGTFFGPFASGTDNDGKPVYWPDIAGADARVIAHWSDRAKTVSHPVLKARYADLSWEMCTVIAGARRDPAMALIATDAYLESISPAVLAEQHGRFQAALRALDLACLLRDPQRTERARAALLRLHQEVMAAKKGTWWIAYDRLMNDKRAGATDEERNQLVADLESLVLHFGDSSKPEFFNPHDLQSAAEKLIKHYGRLKQPDDVKRLHESIAHAFEHFASLGDPLLASAVLQTAVNAFRAAGLPEESKRTRILMQEKIGQAKNHMAAVETEIKIPREDMEKFIAGVVVGDLGRTFATIAAEFLPNRRGLEELIRKSAEESPLQAHMPLTITGEDHVVAKVGSVEEDLFGRVILQTETTFQLSTIWLREVLSRTIEAHSAVPEHFVTWANRSGIFDDMTFLIEGVRAWYDGDLVKTTHVLVPQMERGLRGIAAKLGKPVTKAHPTVAGAGVAIGMGDILYSEELTQALGPDLTLYFLALYADPRGLNLRNRVAHGLIKPETVGEHVAQLLIHTLLVFGVWNELAEKLR